MQPLNYLIHNRAAWNRLAKQRDRLATPARDCDFANPLQSVDGPGWLGSSIEGKTVLCLAAGGGRQAPLYAAAGAVVTVVDLSPAMLELDRAIACKRELNLRTIETSMHDLSMLGDATFDLVIHPVSSCYVPDLRPVFAEIARVLRVDGIYISQHKQPVSLQSDLNLSQGLYCIRHAYYRREALPPMAEPNWIRETGTQEFIHRWESIIGEMCRSGFVIEDLIEPLHARQDAAPDSFEHRAQFMAPYVRIKARRIATKNDNPVRLVCIDPI
jgi:SAM-dependent methyltransferase